MSDALRIALVAEGVTDYEVLKAAVQSMLDGRAFDLKLLQPEESIAFTGGGDAGEHGGGWKGVFKWCSQALDRNNDVFTDDPLFLAYDLFVLHLDADVASEDPARAKKDPMPEFEGVLPCNQTCPPPTATTDALREVILSKLKLEAVPSGMVLCTPSKSTEAWVMAMCFPKDKEMIKKGWECHPKPEKRLSQQPLVQRFSKNQADYAVRQDQFVAEWPRVSTELSEAGRFQLDFLLAVARL